MVSKSLSPSEVAHVWAQGEQYQGAARASGGGMYGSGGNVSAYFERRILYSYGTHFVTGVLVRPQGPDGGGLAFVTAEKNSKTTNARVAEAWQAVRHFAERHKLPTIPRRLAENLASADVPSERPNARDYAESYIRENATAWRDKCEPDSWEPQPDLAAAEALGRVFGLSAAKVRAAVRKGLADAKAKAEAEAEAEAETRRTLHYARAMAERSDSDFRALWPVDTWKDGGERFKADLNGYVRAATAANKARRFKAADLATLKARLKEYRAHFAGTDARLRADYLATKRNDFAAWRDTPPPAFDSYTSAVAYWIGRDQGRAPQAWDYSRIEGEDAADLAEIANRIPVIQAERERAYFGATFAAWQAGTGPRPRLEDYPAESAERAAIEASRAAEREAAAAMWEAWQADETQPRPAANLFMSGELRERFGRTAWERLAEAEREEKLAKDWAAWRSGESNKAPAVTAPDGSAYIRRSRDGETLQTSQGASVPWRHAVAAFRFLKMCRTRGETWRRNGRTIRVGHYQVDEIRADGGFRAGCHSFTWPEIERLAREQGVFDAAPSAEAVEPSAA